MKETVKSLRAYFITAGLLSGYLDVAALLKSPGLSVQMIASVGLVVAIAFLYLAVVLPTLLAKSTRGINAILLLAALLNGFSLVVVVVFRSTASGILGSVVGLLICWYLYVNVKRLAAEARAPASANTDAQQVVAADADREPAKRQRRPGPAADGEPACPHCGSGDLDIRDRYSVCLECGRSS